MGHQQHRAAELSVELAEQFEYFGGRLAVEVSRRFVGQQQGRARDQRPGHGDTLLLAARKLVGAAVFQAGQADFSQQAATTFKLVGRWLAGGDDQRHQHVFQRRESLDEVVELEYEADRVAAQRRAPVVVHVPGRLAQQEKFAVARPVEQADQVEQGALARARGAHQRGEVVALQAQVEAVQHLHFGRLADVVTLADALQTQHFLAGVMLRHGGSPPPGPGARRAGLARPPRRCPSRLPAAPRTPAAKGPRE